MDKKIELYYSQIIKANEDIKINIDNLTSIINSYNYNSIFITGIGKSYHISKKSVATWQSLQINVHDLLIQDLFHGDLGVLKENDIIIYISNSGNTNELVKASEYIKNNFKVIQISITNNNNCSLKNNMNHSINLCNFKIEEADNFNVVPSVSSVIFMMFLDLLGINLSEKNGFTKEDFKKNHPDGVGKLL